MPNFYLFGGPNAAGKTTSALQILPSLGCATFVNADLIANGLSPLDVDAAAWKAGVLMMRHLHELAEKGVDLEPKAHSQRAPMCRLSKNGALKATLFICFMCFCPAQKWPFNGSRRVFARMDITFRQKPFCDVMRKENSISEKLIAQSPIFGRYWTIRARIIAS